METLVISEPKKVQTVGEMAAADVRKAAVFKKFGIEFCCGGNKSLATACTELNLDLTAVENALIKSADENKNYAFEFNRWQADFLIDYIYNQHHIFYYEENEEITKLLEKVVKHHSKKYPELDKVYVLYLTLQQELNSHFAEEENRAFPLIKSLVKAKRENTVVTEVSSETIDKTLHSMEGDHKAAGEILSELRHVTNDYMPPASACTSFKLLYHKLKCLEEDLHQHIHLENNILFPKAILLKKELIKMNLLQ